jgi:hypothetical protein
MVTYLEDTNSLELYNGTAWAAVGSEPGLVHIATVSGTGVSSVSINDCFSADYKAYKIIGNYSGSTSPQTDLRARLRVAGSDSTASSYDFAGKLFNVNDTLTGLNGELQTSFLIQRIRDVPHSFQIDLQTPFQTARTSGNLFGAGIDNGNAGFGATFSALSFRNTTSFTGISFFPATGTITGTFDVWGYNA